MKLPLFRVLFIGNSLTARNDLPGMVEDLLPASAHVEAICVPGASLAMHATDSETQKAIRGGKWTHVVMQEQSEKLSFGPQYTHERVFPWAMMLASQLNPNRTTLVWYETPAHRGGNSLNDSYDAMQTRVRDGYAALDESITKELPELETKTAAVGEAFRKAGSPDVLFTDSVHPSVEGTYLASLVMYRAITGKQTTAARRHKRPKGVSQKFATLARKIADGI